MRKWRLKTAAKCSYIVFREKGHRTFDLNLKIFNEYINYEKNQKYLGFILDRNLKFNTYIDQIKDKCYKKLRILKIINNKKIKLSIKFKIIIYKAIIRSNLDYGASIFKFIEEKTLKNFKVYNTTVLE